MSQFTSPELSGERASFRQSSNYTREFSLRPWWRAALFLTLIIGGSVWLSLKVGRVAWITTLVNSRSIPSIEKALRQDPANPELFHRLGVIYSYEAADVNLSEAEKDLRRAVELNPHSWDYWADLGTTCDFTGDTACSDEAFARAMALNPMSAGLLWVAGNHYLLTDQQDKAFSCFRRLLSLDPHYLEPVFRLCLRATRDPQAIYTGMLHGSNDESARFSFLMFLSSLADYENAMKIWGQMISGPDLTPDLSQVKPFLNFLIDHNQIRDASTVWNDLQRAKVISPGHTTQRDNLLYDGGFDNPRLNSGFDWRISDSPDLAFDFADPAAYKGVKCLRIDFAVGRNADYNLLSQVVLVQPKTRYELSAYVRSDNLSSNSGPRLRVVEIGCATCAVQTSDATTGPTPWHLVEVSFMTQPQTQAVIVSFWRPQDKSSRDITGTVWLDDLSLRVAGASGAEGDPGGIR